MGSIRSCGFLKSCVCFSLFALVAGLCQGAAHAGLITYDFSGTLDTVPSALSSQFTLGDTFTGSFTVDDSVGPRLPLGANPSETNVYDALVSYQLTIGSYSASLTGGPTQEVQADDDGPVLNLHDRYAVVARASSGFTGANVGSFSPLFGSVRLDDTTNTAFSSFDITNHFPTNFTLASFTSGSMFLAFLSGTDAETVSGPLTSLAPEPASVPEPSSMLLAVTATLGAAGGWIRRRRAAGR